MVLSMVKIFNHKVMKIIISIIFVLCFSYAYRNSNANDSDEEVEAKEVLEAYIKEEMDGKIFFLNIIEIPEVFYDNPSYNDSYYDVQYYDWRYFKVSFYYEDLNDKEFSGNYHWNAYVVKETEDTSWKVESLGEP